MRVCEMCRQDPKAAAGGRSSGVGETGPDRKPGLSFFSPPTRLPSGISTRAAKMCSPPRLDKRSREKVQKNQKSAEWGSVKIGSANGRTNYVVQFQFG